MEETRVTRPAIALVPSPNPCCVSPPTLMLRLVKKGHIEQVKGYTGQHKQNTTLGAHCFSKSTMSLWARARCAQIESECIHSHRSECIHSQRPSTHTRPMQPLTIPLSSPNATQYSSPLQMQHCPSRNTRPFTMCLPKTRSVPLTLHTLRTHSRHTL